MWWLVIFVTKPVASERIPGVFLWLTPFLSYRVQSRLICWSHNRCNYTVQLAPCPILQWGRKSWASRQQQIVYMCHGFHNPTWCQGAVFVLRWSHPQHISLLEQGPVRIHLICGPQVKITKAGTLLIKLSICLKVDSQKIGSLFPNNAIFFYNKLPFTADIVRIRPLAEVAGEAINGKESSEHNVPRHIEDIGRNVVEPFRYINAAAKSKGPAQNQQIDRCSHDTDKPEMVARELVRLCVDASGNIVVCKVTRKPWSELLQLAPPLSANWRHNK